MCLQLIKRNKLENITDLFIDESHKLLNNDTRSYKLSQIIFLIKRKFKTIKIFKSKLQLHVSNEIISEDFKGMSKYSWHNTAKSLQSCLTLWDLMSTLGSSVHGSIQARILEWVAIFPTEDLPNPGIEPTSQVYCFGRQVLYH